MAITTASDICASALQEINVLAAGETMSAEDGQAALDALNLLLDQYSAMKLAIPYPQTRTTFTITSGTQTYLVGAGQVINRARPVYVNHIYYQDTSITPTQEYTMDPLTDDSFSLLPQKTLAATVPTYWYYNPTFPDGTVTLWPVPTKTTLQGVMYAPTGLTEFTALTDSLSLPPGWKRALVKNLAADLAGSYGREVDQGLATDAAESLQAVKVSNFRQLDMRLDAGSMGGDILYGWNIKVGP